MANFLRFLVGLALLPACWGVTRALWDALVPATSAPDCWSVLALVGGLFAFVLAWIVLPHPVRTYVFGHEMTHALWGLLFGARPSSLRVGLKGGSVQLTKTNVLITLAPYFFPFYTFLVTLVALGVWLWLHRLPCLPAWMFAIGFSWAFHILFTLETLAQRQPDVTTYGRLFSWTFIYLANVLLVIAWLAAMTPLTFAAAGHALVARTASAYFGIISLTKEVMSCRL